MVTASSPQAARIVSREISDAAAAIRVAELAFAEKVSKKTIEWQRPYRVRFVESSQHWVVEGRDPQDSAQKGGVLLAVIRKQDGHVLDAYMQR